MSVAERSSVVSGRPTPPYGAPFERAGLLCGMEAEFCHARLHSNGSRPTISLPLPAVALMTTLAEGRVVGSSRRRGRHARHERGQRGTSHVPSDTRAPLGPAARGHHLSPTAGPKRLEGLERGAGPRAQPKVQQLDLTRQSTLSLNFVCLSTQLSLASCESNNPLRLIHCLVRAQLSSCCRSELLIGLGRRLRIRPMLTLAVLSRFAQRA